MIDAHVDLKLQNIKNGHPIWPVVKDPNVMTEILSKKRLETKSQGARATGRNNFIKSISDQSFTDFMIESIEKELDVLDKEKGKKKQKQMQKSKSLSSLVMHIAEQELKDSTKPKDKTKSFRAPIK